MRTVLYGGMIATTVHAWLGMAAPSAAEVVVWLLAMGWAAVCVAVVEVMVWLGADGDGTCVCAGTSDGDA